MFFPVFGWKLVDGRWQVRCCPVYCVRIVC